MAWEQGILNLGLQGWQPCFNLGLILLVLKSAVSAAVPCTRE